MSHQCADNNAFAFAGIWNNWVDKTTGEIFKTDCKAKLPEYSINQTLYESSLGSYKDWDGKEN